jgi:prepilin-type N-terminal cleavage/methylation domain-containing protein
VEQHAFTLIEMLVVIAAIGLIKGASKTMAWTKAKTAVVVGVAVLLAAGTTATLIIKYRNQPVRPASSAQAGILKESWTLAGYSTPEDAFQSWLWAMNKGDMDMLLTTFAPELRQQIETATKNDPDVRKKILFKMSQTAKMQSYTITQTNMVSDNQVVLRVIFHKDNAEQEDNWVMKKYGDEWKFLGGKK